MGGYRVVLVAGIIVAAVVVVTIITLAEIFECRPAWSEYVDQITSAAVLSIHDMLGLDERRWCCCGGWRRRRRGRGKRRGSSNILGMDYMMVRMLVMRMVLDSISRVGQSVRLKREMIMYIIINIISVVVGYGSAVVRERDRCWCWLRDILWREA